MKSEERISNKKSSQKKAFSFTKWVNLKERLMGFDRYSSPLRLNINGQESISSGLGVFVSVVLFVTWLIYSIQKFQILVTRTNPNVTVAEMYNYFERSYEVDLNDIGFNLAFGVNDFATGKPLDDPNYVRWTVGLSTWVN